MSSSAPELAVSLRSSWGGQVDIALGNVVGSNIFNVLFILGVSALVAPLLVAPQLIRQEVPFMLGASLLQFALASDGGIGRGDGALLFGLLVAYIVFLIRQAAGKAGRRRTNTRRNSPRRPTQAGTATGGCSSC